MASLILPDSNTFLQLRQANQRHVPEVPQPHKMTVGELGNIALIGTNLLGKTADMASRGIGELQRRSQEQDAIDQRGAEIAQFRMDQNRQRQGEGFGLQQARERMIAEGGRTPMAFDAQGRPSVETAHDVAYPSNEAMLENVQPSQADQSLLALQNQMGSAGKALGAMGLVDEQRDVRQPMQQPMRERPPTNIPQLAQEQIATGITQSGDIGRQIDGGDTLNMSEPRPLRTLAQLRMDALKAGLTNNAGEKARVLEDLAALGAGAYAPQSFDDVLSGGGQENTLKEFSHTLNPPHSMSPEQLALMLARTENARARTVGQNQKNEVFADTGAATAQANLDKARAAADIAAGTVQSQIRKAGSEAALKAEQAKNEPAKFESQQGLRSAQAKELDARRLRENWEASGPGGRAKIQSLLSQAYNNRQSGKRAGAQARTIMTGDTFEGQLNAFKALTSKQRVDLAEKALKDKVHSGEMDREAMRQLMHLQSLSEKVGKHALLPETADEISKLHPDFDLAAVDKMVNENARANQNTKTLGAKENEDLRKAREQSYQILLRHPDLAPWFQSYLEVDPLNPELQ